jgi:hypothetical protein
MEHPMEDPDAFITPWAPEPVVVIDLNMPEDGSPEEEDIEVIREDVRALRASLDGS